MDPRSLPEDGDDLASRVPYNEFQPDPTAAEHPGYVGDTLGSDLVDDPKKILGVREDGTSYTYEEWFEENKVWGRDRDGNPAWVVKWPDNDGYAGKREFFATIADYTAKHGEDLDRIGHPSGQYLGAIENGKVASFEERSLNPQSLNDHYYQYKFNPKADLPEGWKIETGKIAPWNAQQGGARQLRIIKEDGKAASVQDLLDKKIIRGFDEPAPGDISDITDIADAMS